MIHWYSSCTHTVIITRDNNCSWKYWFHKAQKILFAEFIYFFSFLFFFFNLPRSLRTLFTSYFEFMLNANTIILIILKGFVESVLFAGHPFEWWHKERFRPLLLGSCRRQLRWQTIDPTPYPSGKSFFGAATVYYTYIQCVLYNVYQQRLNTKFCSAASVTERGQKDKLKKLRCDVPGSREFRFCSVRVRCAYYDLTVRHKGRA